MSDRQALWLAAHSLLAVDWPTDRSSLVDGRLHLVRGIRTPDQAQKRRRALERLCGKRVLTAWDRDSQQLAIMATEEKIE